MATILFWAVSIFLLSNISLEGKSSLKLQSLRRTEDGVGEGRRGRSRVRPPTQSHGRTGAHMHRENSPH